MPQLKPITVTIGGETSTYNVNGNTQGIASWLKPGGNLISGSPLTVAKRDVKQAQTTRKSTVTLTVPLTTECPTTCDIKSRGSILLKCEVISGVESTQAEREAALATFKALLADADITSAIANNESFWG